MTDDDSRSLPIPPRMLTTSGKRALAAAMIRASDRAILGWGASASNHALPSPPAPASRRARLGVPVTDPRCAANRHYLAAAQRASRRAPKVVTCPTSVPKE